MKGEFCMSEVAEPKNKPIVMLYSGGADSMLMLRLAQMSGRQPYCVLIDYGQKHIEELDYARNQLENQGVSFQTVSIKDLNVDSGLTGELTEARWDNVHEMNVPGRNTIFIGIAIGVAENMGIDEVWYGPDYSDRINLFPDCYQEYVVKMNEVLEISGVKPIKLVAPLLGMSKELILEMLDNFWGIKETDMHSGYEKPEQSCGCDDIDHRCKCTPEGPITARSHMRYA
jgi:7-cyano-7-deazaguanine synthase